MAEKGGVPIPSWVQFAGTAFFAVLTALDSFANANPIPHPTNLGIAFASLTALFFLAPYVAKFKASPSSLDVAFREAKEIATESTDDLEAAVDVIRVVSDLTQDWLSQVNWLNRRLQEADVSDEMAVQAVARFCRERLADVTKMVGGENEKIRASVWWLSQRENGLIFLLSDQIKDMETQGFVFHSGQGILGQAFAESRVWNVADAPAEPGYIKIRQEPPEYRGLLCAPIYFGGHEIIGMVSLDRERAESFDDVDQNLVSALSDVLAYALTLPRITQRFGVLPTHVIASLGIAHEQPALPLISEGDAGAN